MREDDRKRLTWEDATERFLDVTEITAADRAKPMDAAFDTLAYTTHNLLTGALCSMVLQHLQVSIVLVASAPGQAACWTHLASYRTALGPLNHA